jgi:low temperature requirement protein LtrA
MTARDRDEEHRVSTPLELLFDLCFAGAVAEAAGQLEHYLAQGEPARGIGGFALVFAAIWWAWMNFTWFASAYDTDDLAYRITVLVEIAGALILAAGVPAMMTRHDFAIGVTGYVVMRIALVSQWLRAAHDDPDSRPTAQRYAIGVTVVQLGWIGFLAIPRGDWAAGFLILYALDLSVPAWAERAGRTAWHPHHIAERYGLFTLIVLGEAMVGATSALQAAFESGGFRWDLVGVVGGGLLIAFGMWWTYFATPAQDHLRSNRSAFLWGYSHYPIFASVAAFGAGISVEVGYDTGGVRIGPAASAAAVTVPVAVFMTVVWLLHLRASGGLPRFIVSSTPAAVAAVLAATFAGPAAVPLAGLVVAGLIAAKVIIAPDWGVATADADRAAA